MSKLGHFLGHFGIVALTLVSTYSGFVPGRYAPLAIAIGGAAQAALAILKPVK